LYVNNAHVTYQINMTYRIPVKWIERNAQNCKPKPKVKTVDE